MGHRFDKMGNQFPQNFVTEVDWTIMCMYMNCMSNGFLVQRILSKKSPQPWTTWVQADFLFISPLYCPYYETKKILQVFLLEPYQKNTKKCWKS